MLVSSIQNNMTFTSIIQGKAKLPKRESGRLIDFDISKLSPLDYEDSAAVSHILESWLVDGEIDFLTSHFYSRFFETIEGGFYCLEQQGDQSLGKRISGVCELYGNKLAVLRTNPYNGQKSYRDICGIGEVLLGHCLNIARQNGHSKMHIDSLNDSFYRHVFENKEVKMVEGTDYLFSSACAGHSNFYVDLNKCQTLFRSLNKKYKTNFPLTV